MKIVEPYAKMLSGIGSNPTYSFMEEEGVMLLRRVEYAARVSHGSEDAITADSYDRFLRSVVLGHGDWSVTEHEKVTCEFLVDRGITHEIVRHRIGSYTQESTRFINYQKKGGEAKFIRPDLNEQEQYENWHEAILVCEKMYMSMIANGVKPQIARGVLPNSLASKIVMTYNLRNWRHFFIMRTCAQAHPQMRQVTDPLLAEFKEKIPILYEDITPGEQQSAAMARAR